MNKIFPTLATAFILFLIVNFSAAMDPVNDAQPQTASATQPTIAAQSQSAAAAASSNQQKSSQEPIAKSSGPIPFYTIRFENPPSERDAYIRWCKTYDYIESYQEAGLTEYSNSSKTRCYAQGGFGI